MKRLQLLLGISVFWLALSLVSDGITTLILPQRLLSLESEASKATTLGLMSFVGLLAGMLIQPIAGRWSDHLQPRWGRRGTLLLGVLLMLVSLACFGRSQSVLALLIGYLLIQVTASIAQAAQQGFMPDLVPTSWRGTAAGFKGLMDIGGALLGFAVLGQLLKGGDIVPALLVIATVLSWWRHGFCSCSAPMRSGGFYYSLSAISSALTRARRLSRPGNC